MQFAYCFLYAAAPRFQFCHLDKHSSVPTFTSTLITERLATAQREGDPRQGHNALAAAKVCLMRALLELVEDAARCGQSFSAVDTFLHQTLSERTGTRTYTPSHFEEELDTLPVVAGGSTKPIICSF